VCFYSTVLHVETKRARAPRESSIVCADDSGAWVDRELANSKFKDSILVLHDTTELTYHREDGRRIGHLGTSQGGSTTRPIYHTVCGILMHSSLAVTIDGLPLGLLAIKFWTREKFKGSTALKRHSEPPRLESLGTGVRAFFTSYASHVGWRQKTYGRRFSAIGQMKYLFETTAGRDTYNCA
jgi:hypothetical protein